MRPAALWQSKDNTAEMVSSAGKTTQARLRRNILSLSGSVSQSVGLCQNRKTAYFYHFNTNSNVVGPLLVLILNNLGHINPENDIWTGVFVV